MVQIVKYKMGDFVMQVVFLTSLIIAVELVDVKFPIDPNDPTQGEGTLTYKIDGVDICFTSQDCQSFTYAYLESSFPDHFMTEAEFQQIYMYDIPYKAESRRKKRSCPQPPCPTPVSDKDLCCETLRYFKKAPASILVGAKWCYTITCQGINKYQYMPVGDCGPPGLCTGQCVPRHTVHSIVCFQLSPFKFKIGYASTSHYCSCKNTPG